MNRVFEIIRSNSYGVTKSDIAQGLVLSVEPSTFDSLAVNMVVAVAHRHSTNDWRSLCNMSGSKRLPCQKEACAIQKCLQGMAFVDFNFLLSFG